MLNQNLGVNYALAANALEGFSKGYQGLGESEAFELFSAYCRLRGHELEDSMVESGRIGGGGDGGIDWIYLVVNDRVLSLVEPIEVSTLPRGVKVELLIGQAKVSKKWDATVGTKFVSTFRDLFGSLSERSEPQREYSSDLLRASDNLFKFWIDSGEKRPTFTISVVYATMGGSPHKDVQDSINIATQTIGDIFSAEANGELLGAKELFELYSNRPSYDSSLAYVEELQKGDDKVALIKLVDYYRFLCDKDGKLNQHFFEGNVRDYQGEVSVNREIATSLNSGLADCDFWWLNNGITILVSESPISRSKKYTLSDVQIVNGLQTSHAIYNWGTKLDPHFDANDDRTVLVRIISPSSEGVKNNIIRATNSQTPVNKASLRGTDQIHRDIESYLKISGLNYDRRKGYYKNQGVDPRDIISITLLSQAVMAAFLEKPDTARARPSSFLDDDDRYSKIFDQNRSLNEFRWAALCQKSIDRVLLGCKEYSAAERNNLKFYVILVIRMLGGSKEIGHPKWDPALCPNDWMPSDDEILQAARWVDSIARGMLKDQKEDFAVDKLFKGPSLTPCLKNSWSEFFKECKNSEE
ncbi:AIPR family protein [Dermabacteraceae bacterium TAE3-ERU27]|nr:AIPR family protein [Dermabacteraceae bacterium TAE3-ERU27]